MDRMMVGGENTGLCCSERLGEKYNQQIHSVIGVDFNFLHPLSQPQDLSTFADMKNSSPD